MVNQSAEMQMTRKKNYFFPCAEKMTAGTCVKLRSNWLDSLIIHGAEDPREGRHSQLCSPPSPARQREITHDLNTTEFYQWARKQQREVADIQSVREGQRCPHNWFYRWKENTWVERQQSFNILFLSAQQKSRLEKKVGKNQQNRGAVLSGAVWDTQGFTVELQTEGRKRGDNDVSMETSVMETSARAR